eukprot:TRINITY_DN63792_c0_g1_i1.p1 TRINITY_DN63792_c0_g1~~TRINITY_DN63792_c0_g1_i1.p1  ORF type:complete len:325 (-),score=56.91 TRINITY_DN63792_c0_g1_i1:101-943(-)
MVPGLDCATSLAASKTASDTLPYRCIEVETHGDTGVAVLTLSRPKALNALNHELMSEVLEALEAMDKDECVRVIVMTGSGEKAFAAGMDIKEMNSLDFAEVLRRDLCWAWQRVRNVSKPLIGAVNGFALGGGCEVAMLCDIILASEKAKFGQPEINLGTIPGMGGTQRLTRAVGKSKAMEWILTGRQFSAEEAERAGLVSRVVAHDQLLPEAVRLAAEIATKSVPVARLAKAAVNRAYETTLSEGLLFENKMFHATWGLTDRGEGMSAFGEKRKPEFKDR